jgi:hypothetical protein
MTRRALNLLNKTKVESYKMTPGLTRGKNRLRWLIGSSHRKRKLILQIIVCKYITYEVLITGT